MSRRRSSSGTITEALHISLRSGQLRQQRHYKLLFFHIFGIIVVLGGRGVELITMIGGTTSGYLVNTICLSLNDIVWF